MRTILLLVTLLLVQSGSACCGGRSGDIRYTLVSGTTYRIDVIAYTCLSWPSDRPEISVRFDEGEEIIVPRTGIMDDPSSDLRRSEYSFVHDLVEQGWHTVDATLGGRGGGVANVPNSIAEELCIRANFLVDPSIMSNASIAFNTPPTEWVRNWNTFVHDPAATDADGDSLAFELVVPRGSSCVEIFGYQYPEAANFIWLDPENGTILWDYPPFAGTFAIAIKGSEYRDGELIGTVTRDMAVCIEPFIVGIEEIHMAALAIRPTLANEELWIDTPGTWTVEVVDPSGRTCSKHAAVCTGTPIHLTGLASGLYHLRAVDHLGTLRSARFVKVQ